MKNKTAVVTVDFELDRSNVQLLVRWLDKHPKFIQKAGIKQLDLEISKKECEAIKAKERDVEKGYG